MPLLLQGPTADHSRCPTYVLVISVWTYCGFASCCGSDFFSGTWVPRPAQAPLKPWTHSVGELGTNEVDIRVTHNGLCHTDIHMRVGGWGLGRELRGKG